MEVLNYILHSQSFEIFIRILEAVIISGIIGLDREKTRRPAGLRTHVIVALGACIVTVAPVFYTLKTGDQFRLAAQVLSGIGFLGAGTILRFKENVVGLTTAASLWTSACLGIAAGLGAHDVAILGALAVICVLKIVPIVERKYLNKQVSFNISISVESGKKELSDFSDLIKKHGIVTKSYNIEMDRQGNKVYSFVLGAPSDTHKNDFMSELFLLDIKQIKEEKDEYNEE